MKLKFKVQQYQTQAVQAVTDCFAGQSPTSAVQYRVDPGKTVNDTESLFDEGFKNADFSIKILSLVFN